MTVKRVQCFENIRVQEVTLMIDQITRAKNHVNLSSLVFSLSNHVVSRVAFGKTSCNNINFQDIFREIQNSMAEFNIADYYPSLAWINKFNGVDKRLKQNFQDLDKLLDRVIEKHVDPERPISEHEDIVDVLLRTRKEPNQSFILKNEQIKSILTDIFAGGTDTSAATTIWTMAELMRNPTIKRKAQQEIREITKGKSNVEESDIPKLTYLKALIKESLRLHPPIPLLIPRETVQNCTINNKYEIPAKTRVFFNATTIQTNPGYWKNPEKFCPERFLDSQVDFRGQHFEFLPFGSGRRGCPGINFANPLVELALANLLCCFNWELPHGMSEDDLDMEETLGIIIHKKTPLCLVASAAHH